jgi:hypothetical protein
MRFLRVARLAPVALTTRPLEVRGVHRPDSRAERVEDDLARDVGRGRGATSVLDRFQARSLNGSMVSCSALVSNVSPNTRSKAISTLHNPNTAIQSSRRLTCSSSGSAQRPIEAMFITALTLSVCGNIGGRTRRDGQLRCLDAMPRKPRRISNLRFSGVGLVARDGDKRSVPGPRLPLRHLSSRRNVRP